MKTHLQLDLVQVVVAEQVKPEEVLSFFWLFDTFSEKMKWNISHFHDFFRNEIVEIKLWFD